MSAGRSTSAAQVHAVYTSVNRPLTIGGADRRLAFLAISVAGGAFAFFGTVVMSVMLGIAIFSAARWITERDPQGLTIILRSAGARRLYDPAALSFVVLTASARQ